MKYMLLIHQGTTPPPGPRRWASSRRTSRRPSPRLPGDQPDPGRHPGVQLDSPESATTVRVENGEALTTDGPFVAIKEALGGYLFFEADDLDAAIELASRIPAAAWAARSRCDRSWSGSDPRAGLPRRVGPRPRQPDRLPRRLRARRGGRSGVVRDRRRALAPRRHADNPRAWLVTTARNRAIDRIRRERTLAAKTKLLEAPGGHGGNRGRDDDPG